MNAFKYLSPERVNVLENQEVRFSQVQYLNDPFEFLPFISRLMDPVDAESLFENLVAPVLAEIGNRKLAVEDIPAEYRSKISDEALEQITKLTISEALPSNLFKDIVTLFFASPSQEVGINFSSTIRGKWQDMFGVLSLAEVNDHLTMWSHYAKDHSGFVIEFDVTHPFFDRRNGPLDPIRCLKKVKYEITRPDIKLYNASLSESEMINYLVESILLTKSVHWEYEQEVRMIFPLKESERTFEKDGQLIHLHQFDTAAIRAVYLGVNINEVLKGQIAQILTESRYKHVQLYQASLNPSHYKVDFLPVST